jgi:Flp pilus assembly protein TadB
MGLARRKANQLAAAEATATKEIAAAHAADAQQQQQQPAGSSLLKQQQQQQRGRQQQQLQPRNVLRSYLTTLALACGFWLLVQALHKYSAHMAAAHPSSGSSSSSS